MRQTGITNMANLTEVLKRLKAEPEWKELDQSTRCAHLFNPTIRKHNATRARLLAVVEALEAAIKEIEICQEHMLNNGFTIVPREAGLTVEGITAKLSAALEKQ